MSRSRSRWGAAAAFWLFMAVLSSFQIWWVARNPVELTNVYRAIALQCVFYLMWIPFTVGLWRLAARWDLAAFSWQRLILQHLAVAALVAVVQSAVTVAVAVSVGLPYLDLWQIYVNQFRSRIFLQLIIYSGVIASGYALVLHERWRDRQATAARLETQLAEARLASLRAQLHPHFLFNSLHAVASLVRETRNAEAVKLISDMSDLLRRVMDTTTTTHRLADEVVLVRTYLDIQKARFGDRLSSAIIVTPGAEAARVPVLLLQPLVENAIRHGLASKIDPGSLQVTAHRQERALVLEVRDDGIGVDATWRQESCGGTGLSNLRARLHALYGGSASLVAGPGHHGGFVVTAQLPFEP